MTSTFLRLVPDDKYLFAYKIYSYSIFDIVFCREKHFMGIWLRRKVQHTIQEWSHCARDAGQDPIKPEIECHGAYIVI